MAKLRPLKAIRAKCMDCCNGQFKEVRECPITDCPLHEYRMGHRPKSSDEREGFSDLEDADEDFTDDDETDDNLPF